MVHVFWRRNAPAWGVVCLLALCGCPPPAAVRTRPASPPPAPVASPPVARPVTRQDLDAAQQAVRAAPRSSAAYLHLADTYLALGQIADGANALRRAAALDPQSQPPLVALARLYQEAGYQDRECNILRHLVALRTQNPLVYLRLSQIYLTLHWLEPARPLLETTLKLDPNATAGQIEMARYLFLNGNTEQAISQLQATHRKVADNAAVANLLGQYFLASHHYPAAEAVLRETLRFHPSDRDLQVELAFILMQQNRPAVLLEAITLLQGVIASGQRLVEAYTWLGRIYETQNRTEEAIAAYQNAIRLQPSFENVSLALGRLYLRQGKTQEGERLVHFYREIQHNSADYSFARELLEQNLNDAAAHARVAGWYMRLKEYPNAIMEWKRVLELRPGDASARQQLSTALLAAGRLTEARALRAPALSANKRAGGTVE
jgi:predicted Zn-dependent protease